MTAQENLEAVFILLGLAAVIMVGSLLTAKWWVKALVDMDLKDAKRGLVWTPLGKRKMKPPVGKD